MSVARMPHLLLQGMAAPRLRADSAGLSLVTTVHWQRARVGTSAPARRGRQVERHLKGSTVVHTRGPPTGRDPGERASALDPSSASTRPNASWRLDRVADAPDQEGAEFTSETDAEVVRPYCVALRGVCRGRPWLHELRGHTRLAMAADQPTFSSFSQACLLVVAREGGASSLAIPRSCRDPTPARARRRDRAVRLRARSSSPDGAEIKADVDRVDWNQEEAERRLRDFMLKDPRAADAWRRPWPPRGDAGVELRTSASRTRS